MYVTISDRPCVEAAQVAIFFISESNIVVKTSDSVGFPLLLTKKMSVKK